MASSAIPSSYTPFIKQKNLGLSAFSAQSSFFSLRTPKKNVSKKIASVMAPQPSERNPSTTGSVAADVKLATNWIMDDIAAYLKKEKLSYTDIKLTPDELGELIASIKSGTITREIGKEILFELMAKGGTVEGLIKEKYLVPIVDPIEIEKMVDKVIAANPNLLEVYRWGETTVQGYFADQIMKESKRKVNPGLLNKILLEKLNAKS